MGAARKLQAEIDRTLKKVQEGIIEFDEIWDKVYDTDSQSQREKYEGDLKKEIKKLQRLRDQIKTWINGSDIKDKSSLMDARKNIEKKMEQFKNCEKEAKTKAFSKAGLDQATRLDPEEKARQATREWLNEQVETLRMQIDEFEAELESFNSSRRGKKPSDRQQVLEECVVRHQGHISRLEQCMRCLDNCTVTYSEIDDLRDMVEYYVSEDQEDYPSYTTVDETYSPVLDRLNDVTLGLQSVPMPTKVKKSKDLEEELAERERERERAAAAAVKATLLSHGSNVSTTAVLEEDKKPTTVKTPVPNSAPKRRVSLSEVPSGNHLMVEEAEVLENNKTANSSSNDKKENPTTGSNGNISFALAAAGRTPTPNSTPQKQPNLTHSSKGEDGDYPKLPSSGSEKTKSLELPGEIRSNLKQNSMELLTVQKSALSNESISQLSPKQNQETQPSIQTALKSAPSSSSAKPPVNDLIISGISNHSADTSTGGNPDPVDPLLATMNLEQLTSALSMQCGDIKGVASSPGQFEGNPAASLQLLRACNRGAMPQPIDGDYRIQLSQNTTRGIMHQLPASYPLHRLPQLEDTSFYQRLDTEGLFYSFYFHPDDVTQYCAAKELKQRTWRYHLEHKFWFQPTGEPKVKTEDFEEGSCTYFDRVLSNAVPGDSSADLNGWCYRRKDNFMFTKDQVEDDLH